MMCNSKPCLKKSIRISRRLLLKKTKKEKNENIPNTNSNSKNLSSFARRNKKTK